MLAYIIGNGTSLRETNLDLIAGKPSYACNRISLIYPDTKWRPTVYLHPESIGDDTPYIQENIDLGITCYIGERYAPPPRGVYNIQDAPNVHWIKECWHWGVNFDNPEALDEWHFPQPCTFGGSVNLAMQYAVLDGFDDLVLLGCDLLYRDKKQSHFHPNYKHGNEQPAFYAAKNALWGHIMALTTINRKKLNVRVRNATVGGMLDIWPRVKLEDTLE